MAEDAKATGPGVPLISVHYATVATPSIHAGSGGVRCSIPF